MLNIGAGEVLVVLVLALLVLGPDKLPSTARTIGRTLHQLRRFSSGFEQEIRSAMDYDPQAPAAAPRNATSAASGVGVGTPQALSPGSQSSTGTSSLHPGLGRGPRIDAGAVDLSSSAPPAAGGGPSTGQASDRVSSTGPDESFS